MGVKIRQARESEAELLTELALRSKSHWPYSKEYLAECRPILTVTRELIRKWPVLVAECDGLPVGFSALLFDDGKRLLDHLWVEPGQMGQGLGRSLFDAASHEARNLGWSDFEIISDPYAEPFYSRMGAQKTGQVESRIQKGLFLPVMRFSVKLLRGVSDSDLPVFFEHQKDPDAVRMAAFPSRDREDFLNHWQTKVLKDPKNIVKTVVTGSNVVGNILSWEKNDKRLIGYWIGTAHWNRGLATAALREFLRDYETTRPVYAYVASRNLGSIRVLEKCGFRQVGPASTASDGVEEYLMELAEPSASSEKEPE